MYLPIRKLTKEEVYAEMEPKHPGISVVIPTLNEEGNIKPLVGRLSDALEKRGAGYELIFVDDHSTDRTRENIKSLENKYPISLYLKKGQAGKAQSLLEGFSYAKYELVAMIDADLQYPPEAIPKMADQISSGSSDIIVAKRRVHHEGFGRSLLSRGFMFFFGELLHGLDQDVQSGLKVFRREIIERLTLAPSQWAFDMEFLVKAKSAGYRVGSFDIIFEKRFSGEAKIKILEAVWEIGWSAVKLKFSDPGIIPFNEEMVRRKGQGFHHKGVEFIPHSSLSHRESAYFRLVHPQELILFLLVLLLALGFLFNWTSTLKIIVAFLTILYFIDLLFNLFLIFRSFSKAPEIKISREEISARGRRNWPTYTIFCPLYKEWEVIEQFVTAMRRLDYPENKLQILLLLEEDDLETIRRAEAMRLPPSFEIAIIPHSRPKTKPKALNFGLSRARGEYTVIYDAEDIPDPDQLKKAVLAFEKAHPKTICVQAKLNFYNPSQNILTRVFTAEYSLWFDLVLTGLQSIHAPIPLGGTSNHFRTDDIRKLQGWDAFNVTEDCDLGMRLVKRGYLTAVVDSMTLEEANSDLKNWFRQRTRWIKGYMQTYFVHMRNPQELIKDWRKPHIATFQLIVGGKIFSMFINPFMWVITILYFSNRAYYGPIIEPFYPSPVLYMGVFSLIFGNFLYLYYYMIGCAKRGYYDLIKYVFLVPFYWMMMSIAAWKALYEMFFRPHYWAKTLHGLHLSDVKGMGEAEQKLVDQELLT